MAVSLHFLILVGGLLVIMIACMIFLSPFLDVIRMSIAKVFFFAQLDWNSLHIECLSLTYNLKLRVKVIVWFFGGSFFKFFQFSCFSIFSLFWRKLLCFYVESLLESTYFPKLALNVIGRHRILCSSSRYSETGFCIMSIFKSDNSEYKPFWVYTYISFSTLR